MSFDVQKNQVLFVEEDDDDEDEEDGVNFATEEDAEEEGGDKVGDEEDLEYKKTIGAMAQGG